MTETEMQIVEYIFEWLDSFGPGTVSFEIAPELTEVEASELVFVIGGCLP